MTPDYSQPACNTLIFGGGSTGKTTMAYRVMLNVPGVSCRFIFDEDGQAARRLKLRPCFTVSDCEAALGTRWVDFSPYRMFREDQLTDALNWFAGWSYGASMRGRGKKIFYVDEMWKYCNALRPPPPKLEKIIRTGRWWNLQFLSSTHRPREYHANIRALVTEWICFNTIEPEELKAVRPYFPGVDKVATLPRGSWISYFRENGAETSGKLF